MKAIAFLIMLCVGSCLARGDNGRPAPKAALAKPKVIDLDFTEDEEAVAERAARVPVPQPSHQWIYWTVGATVVAGGVGWYLHEDQKKQPVVTRNEQIFTDERK